MDARCKMQDAGGSWFGVHWGKEMGGFYDDIRHWIDDTAVHPELWFGGFGNDGDLFWTHCRQVPEMDGLGRDEVGLGHWGRQGLA